MSKEEILETIKKMAEELGRAPSLPELRDKTGISPRQVQQKLFIIYGRAQSMRPGKRRRRIHHADGCAVQRLGGTRAETGQGPEDLEYDMYAKYSARPLLTRFGTWGESRRDCCLRRRQAGLGGRWEDVLEVARCHLRAAGKAVRRSRTANRTPNQPKIMKDRPTYGPPLMRVPLVYGPTNEQGVLFLFGSIAEDLGFVVTRVQIAFPDCEAMREVAPGVWQPVDIELEQYSRNFVSHMHDPEQMRFDCVLGK